MTPRSMKNAVFLGNLFFSLTIAATIYTNSSFVESIAGVGTIGIFYAVGALFSIIALSYSAKLLGRTGNRTFFLLYGALYALSLATLALPAPDYLKLCAFVTYLFAGNAIVFSLDVFFERLTENRGRGRDRGLYLLLGSTGIMLGPFLGARVFDMWGYPGTYAAALFIFALFAFVFSLNLDNYSDPLYTPHSTRLALGRAWKKKTLRSVIAANFILQFFYVWMVIYTPIYLSQHLGFSWDTIGIIFTVMLSAFVILDYPLGRLADWLGTEKELAAIGFLIMSACTIALALASSQSVLFIGTLLLFSRVGASAVETMTEIHFFKITEDTDSALLSVFCDLRPIAYIAAPLLGTIVISFLPFQAIFGILGLILLGGSFLALKMEGTPGWWQRAHTD